LAASTHRHTSRAYVASPPLSQALRRRSRRQTVTSPTPNDDGSDDEDDETGDNKNRLGYSHAAITEPGEFSTSASALIDKIYTAIQPMERVNDPFFLTRGYEEDLGPFVLLDLGPLKGQYTIQIDLEQSLATMTTPRSGQIAYILSLYTKPIDEGMGQYDGRACIGGYAGP
jgi:hypothetical protein